MKSKKEIRQEMIQKRNELNNQEYENRSRQICEKIMKNRMYREAEVIYAYMDIKQEVSLKKLILEALEHQKIIGLPRVEGKEIVFYQVASLSDLEEGSFHVLEPKNTCIPAPEPSLILVPGVAFTTEGKRLGYGGGFYDRFLSNHSCFTIGVGYGFQVLEELPVEEHDMKLDEIIVG